MPKGHNVFWEAPEAFTDAVIRFALTPAAGPRIEPINVGEGDLKYRAVFEIVLPTDRWVEP